MRGHRYFLRIAGIGTCLLGRRRRHACWRHLLLLHWHLHLLLLLVRRHLLHRHLLLLLARIVLLRRRHLLLLLGRIVWIWRHLLQLRLLHLHLILHGLIRWVLLRHHVGVQWCNTITFWVVHDIRLLWSHHDRRRRRRRCYSIRKIIKIWILFVKYHYLPWGCFFFKQSRHISFSHSLQRGKPFFISFDEILSLQ